MDNEKNTATALYSAFIIGGFILAAAFVVGFLISHGGQDSATDVKSAKPPEIHLHIPKGAIQLQMPKGQMQLQIPKGAIQLNMPKMPKGEITLQIPKGAIQLRMPKGAAPVQILPARYKAVVYTDKYDITHVKALDTKTGTFKLDLSGL